MHQSTSQYVWFWRQIQSSGKFRLDLVWSAVSVKWLYTPVCISVSLYLCISAFLCPFTIANDNWHEINLLSLVSIPQVTRPPRKGGSTATAWTGASATCASLPSIASLLEPNIGTGNAWMIRFVQNVFCCFPTILLIVLVCTFSFLCEALDDRRSNESKHCNYIFRDWACHHLRPQWRGNVRAPAKVELQAQQLGW